VLKTQLLEVSMSKQGWALAAVVLVCAGTALAAGPKLKPGKWEFVTTSKMPMMPQPRTETSTDCITEENVDPTEQFVDTMKWAMECRTGEGVMNGTGRLTANGTTANGGMEMKFSAQGMDMTIETEWKGKRIGDCD
jgi:hypothetical protein